MKSFQYALVAGLFVAAAVSASAFPPGRTGGIRTQKSISEVEDFEGLKAGDKVGFVCMECEKMATTEVVDKEDAMMLCKEGGEVVCPYCTKTYKIVRHGPPGKGGTHREVTYVNADGKECAFMTKIEE